MPVPMPRWQKEAPRGERGSFVFPPLRAAATDFFGFLVSNLERRKTLTSSSRTRAHPKTYEQMINQIGLEQRSLLLAELRPALLFLLAERLERERERERERARQETHFFCTPTPTPSSSLSLSLSLLFSRPPGLQSIPVSWWGVVAASVLMFVALAVNIMPAYSICVHLGLDHKPHLLPSDEHREHFRLVAEQRRKEIEERDRLARAKASSKNRARQRLQKMVSRRLPRQSDQSAP